VTCGRLAYFLRGQPRPPPQGRVPASQMFWRPPDARQHTVRNSYQVLHGDQTRGEEFLHGRPRPLPWPKFLVTRMLTRDRFAVADLVIKYIKLLWAVTFDNNAITILVLLTRNIKYLKHTELHQFRCCLAMMNFVASIALPRLVIS